MEEFDLENLEWLMPNIDCELILSRLGIYDYKEINTEKGLEYLCYCPDHHLFVKREPSDPKWYFNTVTGKTFCHTEGRGSNILWTISRLKGLDWKESLEWMTGGSIEDDIREIKLNNSKRKLKQILSETKKEKSSSGFLDVQHEITNNVLYKEAIDFFMYPPGKKPTLIKEDTVRHFKVTQRTWGYYSNRAIVPFFQKKEIVGFCAIDILGKDEWIKKHPGLSEKEYKKVLYSDGSTGFRRNETVFGYDEVPIGAETLFIVEGARETMKMFQEGFHSVAILGTHVSPQQIVLLSELNPKEVVIMMDGDSAGRSAAVSIAKSLFELFNVKILDLPEGVDPKVLDREGLMEVQKMKRNFIFSLNKRIEKSRVLKSKV